MMRASDPRPSRWAEWILVMTAIVGAPIRASRSISPGTFIPISTTAAPCSGPRPRSVRGRPMRLLKFPVFFNTFRLRLKIAAVISLVLVLPLLPETAITGMSNLMRRFRASSPSAKRVSLTKITAAEAPGGRVTPRDTITAPAPFATASSTKAWPSWFSPGRAMKQSPGLIPRVSVQTEPIPAPGSPESSLPPASPANVATVPIICGPSGFRDTFQNTPLPPACRQRNVLTPRLSGMSRALCPR